MRRWMISLIALLPLLAPTAGWAWGCTGHEVVAYIAAQNLNPKAAKQVAGLLKNAKYAKGVIRYCAATDLGKMEYFSTWADDTRTTTTASWHFWDIPLDKTTATSDEFCDPGCVVHALTNQLVILRNSHKPRLARQQALMYIIHFVGDSHQPMHISDNGDRGGNCVPIDFEWKNNTTHTKEESKSPGSYSPNLHSIWDSSIIESMTGTLNKTNRDQRTKAFADSVIEEYHSEISSLSSSQVDFQAWALQTHPLAKSNAYDPLPAKIAEDANPHTLKNCVGVSNGFFQLHELANDDYVKQAQPIVKEQLARAGARLAATLNSVWPQS